MSRRATAQDVADLAGVSRSAVSLVLNGRAEGNISRVKQQAVRDAAHQLRYTPNAVALSLRSQRTATIGVLTWADRRSTPLALLRAVHTAAAQADYLVMMVDVVLRPKQVSVLMDRRVDGFVVVAPELTTYEVPESLAGTPTVLLNCVEPEPRRTSLVPDEVGAGASAVQVLVEAGHRRIAVVAGADDLTSRQRAQGARQALTAAGLPLPQIVGAGDTVAAGFRATAWLLESPHRPTAVVCTHERLAVGALAAVTQEGLEVPDDLSLVSLDDGEDLAAGLVPPVHLVQRPDEVLARHALELLVDEMRKGHPAARQLTFVCPVQPGHSVAAPPSRRRSGVG